jgi:glucose/arabinose dehydrogenase
MHYMYKYLVGIVVLAVLGWGGYVAYQYVKADPPDFLINLFARHAASQNPLPPGPEAPVRVPEGFSATIFARDVPGARVMVRDPKGAILVSLTREGKVVALPDLNADQVADETKVVLSGLRKPHGLAVMCPNSGNASADQDACVLYVAQEHEVTAYDYDADTYAARNGRAVAVPPTEGGGHYTRTLLQHPDGERLLVSIGSSCNACEEKSPLRASVQVLDVRTGLLSTFATGLRNTVFMTIHPVTGALWGTDNGRDLIGDDIPPDEVNILKLGSDYGWPYCYGNNIEDTSVHAEVPPCQNSTPPKIALPAHVAPLGLAFVPEEGWPEEWWHDLIVAYHGSWNRSQPVGYKVVRFDYSPDGRVLQDQFSEDFVTGFLPAGADEDEAIGRPVDVLIEPGGIMYLSDDYAGAVYRIVYTGERP